MSKTLSQKCKGTGMLKRFGSSKDLCGEMSLFQRMNNIKYELQCLNDYLEEDGMEERK